MRSAHSVLEPQICLFADHLDAALAAGEDLQALALAPDLSGVEGPRRLSDFVARVARLEASLLAHVLQARRLAAAVQRLDGDVRRLEALFIANTALLVTLIDEFGDRAHDYFATGADPLAFLRRRALLAEDAATVSSFDELRVTEEFRIGGVVELGPLLDLVGAFLDVLDRRFDLYGEAARQAALSASIFQEHRQQAAGRSAAPAAGTSAAAPLTGASLAEALVRLEQSRSPSGTEKAGVPA